MVKALILWPMTVTTAPIATASRVFLTLDQPEQHRGGEKHDGAPLAIQPMTSRSITLKNHIVVAPLHQYPAVSAYATDRQADQCRPVRGGWRGLLDHGIDQLASAACRCG